MSFLYRYTGACQLKPKTATICCACDRLEPEIVLVSLDELCCTGIKAATEDRCRIGAVQGGKVCAFIDDPTAVRN
jgi:hypothetical protein